MKVLPPFDTFKNEERKRKKKKINIFLFFFLTDYVAVDATNAAVINRC